jgi:hypothetical protein
MGLSANRFFNLVYFWATEDSEESEKDKFDMRLHKPDIAAIRANKPLPASSPWAKENEEAALGDFVGMLSGATT